MADTLESLGFFRQELVKSFSSGRKVYKGISLRTKEVVLIQELTFERNLQAQVYSQEIRKIQVLTHQAAGKVFDCVLAANRCYVVGEFLPVTLEEAPLEWDEEALWAFLGLHLDLFAEAQSKGVYYRNVAPDCFWMAGQSSRFFECSGYYYLKEPLACLSPAVLSYLSASDDEEALGSPLPFHNPYKSEVYSLAMVLLTLARKEPLPDITSEESVNRNAVSRLIEEIPCSEKLKNVLFRMTDFNEETRLDPIQAVLYMKGELDMTNTALFLEQHHSSLAVIEARMQSQLSRSNTIRKCAVLRCVCCLVPIRVGSNTDVEELEVLLLLKCPRKNHLFCGVECMMKYAYIQTAGSEEAIDQLNCPICQYSLPTELRSKIREKWDESSVLTLSRSASHVSDTSAVNLRVSCPSVLSRLVSVDTDLSVPRPGSVCMEEEIVSSQIQEIHIEIPLGASTAPRADPDIQNLRSSSILDFPTDCGRCGELISLENSSSQPVFLYCSPADHAFCSKRCLREYSEHCLCSFLYDLDKVTCPKCFQPIASTLVLDSFGGAANFTALQTAVRRDHQEDYCCMECRTNAGVAAPCGHIFCEECRSGWSWLTRKGLVPCPVCNQPIALAPRPGMLRTIVDYARTTVLGE